MNSRIVRGRNGRSSTATCDLPRRPPVVRPIGCNATTTCPLQGNGRPKSDVDVPHAESRGYSGHVRRHAPQRTQPHRSDGDRVAQPLQKARGVWQRNLDVLKDRLTPPPQQRLTPSGDTESTIEPHYSSVHVRPSVLSWPQSSYEPVLQAQGRRTPEPVGVPIATDSRCSVKRSVSRSRIER